MHTPITLKSESDKTGWGGLTLVDCENLSIANLVMQLDDSEMDNAALIVKAVNSYEAMKETLETLYDDAWMSEANRTLIANALAEGKE